MSIDSMIEVQHATLGRTDIPTEPAVRVYCFQHGKTWSLQVRGITEQKRKPGFFATASMNLTDMRDLRDTITKLLAESGLE